VESQFQPSDEATKHLGDTTHFSGWSLNFNLPEEATKHLGDTTHFSGWSLNFNLPEEAKMKIRSFNQVEIEAPPPKCRGIH
jgi:hypothetical protein